MLTKEQIRKTAKDVITEHGMMIVHELQKGDNYDGSNLAALLELFGDRLSAIESNGIIDAIDGRMGAGWARELAEALVSPNVI